MTLNNKVALVTSATRGIGFSSSLKLAQEEANKNTNTKGSTV